MFRLVVIGELTAAPEPVCNCCKTKLVLELVEVVAGGVEVDVEENEDKEVEEPVDEVEDELGELEDEEAEELVD